MLLPATHSRAAQPQREIELPAKPRGSAATGAERGVQHGWTPVRGSTHGRGGRQGGRAAAGLRPGGRGAVHPPARGPHRHPAQHGAHAGRHAGRRGAAGGGGRARLPAGSAAGRAGRADHRTDRAGRRGRGRARAAAAHRPARRCTSASWSAPGSCTCTGRPARGVRRWTTGSGLRAPAWRGGCGKAALALLPADRGGRPGPAAVPRRRGARYPTCPRCTPSWPPAGSAATWSARRSRPAGPRWPRPWSAPTARSAGCRWPGRARCSPRSGAPARAGRGGRGSLAGTRLRHRRVTFSPARA